jgi:hypothetical protein
VAAGAVVGVLVVGAGAVVGDGVAVDEVQAVATRTAAVRTLIRRLRI